MKDRFGRKITYLRLSVTDLCNLRCRYCMPAEGICQKSHEEMLTEDEMIQAVEAAASLGITKVRITGGEPLVKKNIVSICRRTAAVPGIREVCMTTNGILLPELAEDLRQAGVKRINLSLDTLDADKYHRMTRGGSLKQALRGLDAALKTGFEKVKINTVLIGGFNDDEIRDLAELSKDNPVDVRFIELMPMYDGNGFEQDAFLSRSTVWKVLPELVSLSGEKTILEEEIMTKENITKENIAKENMENGVARLYQLPGAKGRIGLISPISSHFCGSCNRLRLTADGKLKPCLHSSQEFSIKGKTRAEMAEQMEIAILAKPQQRSALGFGQNSEAGRSMNRIGG